MNMTPKHTLLMPDTISRINRDNYKVASLGQGTQAAVWLVVGKLFYGGERDAFPEGADKTASRVHLGQELCVAKAEAVGAVAPLKWDLRVMRTTACIRAAERGYTPTLREFDAHNLRWYTATYEGPNLSDLYWEGINSGTLFAFDLVWTVTHQLVKIVSFLQFGVDHSDDEPVPDWEPVAHCDLMPFNVTCKMFKGRLRLSFIDWGRAAICGNVNPGGQTWSPALARMDTYAIARVVHWLIHNRDLHDDVRQCTCTTHQLGSSRFAERTETDKAQLAAFFESVCEPLCFDESVPGQRSIRDTLRILENPDTWRTARAVRTFKPRAGLTPALKPFYEARFWTEKAAIKIVEGQYRRDRGMRVTKRAAPVMAGRARPPTRANPGVVEGGQRTGIVLRLPRPSQRASSSDSCI